MSRFSLARRQHTTFSSNSVRRFFYACRMLKQPLFAPSQPQRAETRLSPSFVLATLDSSTYEKKKYASPSRLLRPCWEGCFNILYGTVKRGTA